MQKTCKDSSFWSVWFIRTKQWHIMCFSSWEHFFRWVQGRWICTTDFRTSLQDWKGLLSSLVNGFYPLSRDFVACHFTLQHFYSHPLFLYTYRVKSGEILKAVNTFALRWHVKDWSTWSSVLSWCSDVLFEAACLWQSPDVTSLPASLNRMKWAAPINGETKGTLCEGFSGWSWTNEATGLFHKITKAIKTTQTLQIKEKQTSPSMLWKLKKKVWMYYNT